MAKRAKTTKRLYYKIGEACKLLEIQPYVLRYWETEFPALSPNKSRSGQRVYSERELAVIRRIKQLLYEEGYTIAGAKKKLETELAEGGLEEAGTEPVEKPPVKRRTTAKSGKSAGASANGSEATKTSGELDTQGAEQIENIRAGIEKLLGQARELLAFLDSKPL